ncbi:MAG: isocitrate lyase/PEP mutase family protein [Parvibaculaceae bacterium]|nr:isocitrate lyase/PEP mutase family protein [Parvibaculaceae bacterium]
MSTAAVSFEKLLAGDDIILAPGTYDALSARIAAQAGAKAVYLSGFSVTGSVLGLPDVGLMSATEMADRVRAMAAACAPTPLIADGDTGHGGPLNAARLVTLYEQGGAACIQIEDQVFPKRCGHMANKEVVPVEVAAANIRSACAARQSAAFKIMARTDARAPLGYEEALRRADAYLEAGADILFIEAPQSVAELEAIAERYQGIPLVANMVEDGKTPYLDGAALQNMGYKIALFPVSALLCVTQKLETVFDHMLASNQLPADEPRVSFSRYNEIVGLSDLLAEAAEAEDKSST